MSDLLEQLRSALVNAVAFARIVKENTSDRELIECADHVESECHDAVNAIEHKQAENN